MKRALSRLPESPHYGRSAFTAGLRSVGYEVVSQIDKPTCGDLIVVWNRQSGYHEQVSNFESSGGRALVVENGYFGKAWRGGDWFAVSLDHHAGAGQWPDGGPERWDSWGVELMPWKDGSEVVILGQRCIGEPGIASPLMWAEKLHKRLPNSRIRQHPGPQKAPTGLLDDLKNASAVATWASSAGLLALMAGVPCFCDFHRWIGASACRSVDDLLSGAEPLRDDEARLAMFRRLAHAMWSADEVSSGQAFVELLG